MGHHELRESGVELPVGVAYPVLLFGVRRPFFERLSYRFLEPSLYRPMLLFVPIRLAQVGVQIQSVGAIEWKALVVALHVLVVRLLPMRKSP